MSFFQVNYFSRPCYQPAALLGEQEHPNVEAARGPACVRPGPGPACVIRVDLPPVWSRAEIKGSSQQGQGSCIFTSFSSGFWIQTKRRAITAGPARSWVAHHQHQAVAFLPDLVWIVETWRSCVSSTQSRGGIRITPTPRQSAHVIRSDTIYSLHFKISDVFTSREKNFNKIYIKNINIYGT